MAVIQRTFVSEVPACPSRERLPLEISLRIFRRHILRSLVQPFVQQDGQGGSLTDLERAFRSSLGFEGYVVEAFLASNGHERMESMTVFVPMHERRSSAAKTTVDACLLSRPTL